MILVTGSSGLIGRHLTAVLRDRGLEVRGFDIREALEQDTRRVDQLATAVKEVRGIVHLAAVSRVVWAEQQPILAESVNVEALRQILELISRKAEKPWIIFGSSREVYGDAIQAEARID